MITDAAARACAKTTLLEQERIMETSIVRVAVNGYPIQNPVGRKAAQLEVAVFASDCDASIRHGVTEITRRLFSDTPVSWRSAARAYFALGRRESNANNMVGVIWGVDESEVFVVRDGLLESREHVAGGSEALIKRLSSGLPEEAHTLVHLASIGESTAEATHRLHGAFARIEGELVSQFSIAFQNASENGSLPSQLVLFAPPAFMPLLKHLFSRREFNRFTQASQTFVVHPFKNVSQSHDTVSHAAAALINIESGLAKEYA